MASADILTGQGLIKTKYNKPGISPVMINRPRISEKLDRALKHKLTIVAAPAGYGKSTAVLEWLEARRLPCAWLSLDNMDNDPARFWRYFIAAVVEVGFVHIDREFTEISMSKELISSNLLIDLFIEKLCDTAGNIIMALDDYHLIYKEIVQKKHGIFY